MKYIKHLFFENNNIYRTKTMIDRKLTVWNIRKVHLLLFTLFIYHFSLGTVNIYSSDITKNIPIFFENYIGDAPAWKYPDDAVIERTDEVIYEGSFSLKVVLDNTTYSGAALEFSSNDLTELRGNGALVFFIKSEYKGLSYKIELRDSRKDSMDVSNTIKITQKTTREWKKVVIPLKRFKKIGTFWDISGSRKLKFDWNDVDTFVISIDPQPKPFIVYLDNIHIDPNYQVEDGDDEIMKQQAELEKTYKRKVIYNFDDNSEGWTHLRGEGYDDTTKGVKYTPISKSKIPREDRKGHGEGVLAIDVDLKTSDFSKFALHYTKSENWSRVKYIEYEVYISSDGTDALEAAAYIQSDNWNKWWLADDYSVELIPGKWIKTRLCIDELQNLHKNKIDGYGVFFWGAIDKEYKGPLYIDNWTVYKEIRNIMAEEKTEKELNNIKQKFTPIDLSKAVNRGFFDEYEGDGKGGWTDQGNNDMRYFKLKGRQIFAGVEFNIIDHEKNNGKSCLVLRGQNQESFPINAEIEVNSECAGIYFLHNSAWCSGVVGRYRILYDDSTEEVVKLNAGEDIFDWWTPSESDTSRIAWLGSNLLKSYVGLNLFAWKNPHPKKKVNKIIAETDGDKSFLMLAAVTLTDKGPYLPVIENEKLDVSEWFVYEDINEDRAKGTALDMSSLLDAPSGKHGYLKAKGDKYCFDDGTEARFWGINLVASANFPDHETSEKIAKQLARIGVNVVRHHHMDADWSHPNIFGNNPDKTTALDKEALDRFDYLWAQLKKRGIYLYIDLCVNRAAKPEDKIEKPLNDISAGYKIEGEFDPRLIKLQKRYAKQLLTHKNPYTGTTLAEDPAVIMIEIINEDSLFYIQPSGIFGINSGTYKNIWQNQFNEWLKKNFKNRENLLKRWDGLGSDEDPQKGTVKIPPDYKQLNYSIRRKNDIYKFIHYTQDKYYKDFVKYLRAIGVKCLITGSNHWTDDLGDLYLNAKLDYIDRHAYWAHPQGGWGYFASFDPSSMLKSNTGGYVGELASKRVFGKPYIISEWQNAAPNEYRAEGELIMSVYSCLHNWNAIQFAYNHSNQFSENLGANFDIYNQPAQLGLWPVTALIFHRKDVQESKKGVFLRVTQTDVLNPLLDPGIDIYKKAALAGKTGVMFADVADDPLSNNRELLDKIKFDDRLMKSVTGEIEWDIEQGLLKLDTKNSQAMAGFPDGKAVLCQDVNFNITNDYAVVVLSSLSEKPIKESKRLLLTAVARVRQRGMSYNSFGSKVEKMGSLPVLVEPVKGEVILKVNKPFKVYKLSTSGERKGSVEIREVKGGYSIKLSAGNKCMHYEIEK